MIALITGASSGIGRSMAIDMAIRGFNLVLVARNMEKLKEVKDEIECFSEVRVKLISKDLSDLNACRELYNEVKRVKIDVLINNAGFGLFGNFNETDLERELEMIDLNIKAVHVLTKLFYNDFRERDYGYIMNVASIAGEMAGPKLSTYYASKNYVVQLTKAIAEEAAEAHSNVSLSVLCPGPVKTNFNETAGLNFIIMGQNSDVVAEYAIDKMFERKLIIHPNLTTQVVSVANRLIPSPIMLKLASFVQSARTVKD